MTVDIVSLTEIAAKRPLSKDEASSAFSALLKNMSNDAQIGGFLMVLKTRGETVEEYAAAARVMRECCQKVHCPDGAIDIVGTGGDGKGTLNISTAAAFVAAGAGAVVAKHGNKKLSSRSGSADLLGQMGIEVMVERPVVEQALNEAGIAFMMAPKYHTAMKHVATARTQLATRTIFNILGPLTNPAGVKRQLTGAFSKDLLHPMAETLRKLGSQRAWLVHGGDGTDEISIAGPSCVVSLEDGGIQEFEVHPEEFGLQAHPFENIVGGDPINNGHAFRDLLDGNPSAYRDAVLLNAAAALVIAGLTEDYREAAEMAAQSIDSNAAWSKVHDLVKITQGK